MVVDDHKMFVEGVQAIFSDSSHIQVVKTVHDGNEVMKSIENTPNLDIILLDINLPNINGLELTKLISKKYPAIKILILSMYNNAEYIKEVLKEGASGYVLKNTDHEELLNAIQSVFAGNQFYSQSVTQTMMNSFAKKSQRNNTDILQVKISKREKEILSLIIKEHTAQEIANMLFISLHTVETHRSNLMSKLGVRNSAGLVRVALENNLV
ncbi:MAG: response regulator transcription factor [Saprospiraceae bacterium]|jgi:DNA-binding NarL/FixJ family response regulator|nr:response regulator transcription factor [Saprospiraceae bacterium]MCA0334346.1 response regulator transcription factor [Bacteroidota bacterium]MCB0604453.1 response regulator transcription factor [Saprospiraceae bacterium]MCO5277219.1 response regulator transcription factor [Saprospiraceae bacterium]HQU95081.1 response regulator transcription factor [Saprospiraceae bacterium]